MSRKAKLLATTILWRRKTDGLVRDTRITCPRCKGRVDKLKRSGLLCCC